MILAHSTLKKTHKNNGLSAISLAENLVFFSSESILIFKDSIPHSLLRGSLLSISEM
jgi:hypothetical protein